MSYRCPMAPAPPIRVNRTPVLTLWATVVVERLGHPPETALTLGRFVAGSSARAKAQRLGIIDEEHEAEEPHAQAAALRLRPPSAVHPEPVTIAQPIREYQGPAAPRQTGRSPPRQAADKADAPRPPNQEA